MNSERAQFTLYVKPSLLRILKAHAKAADRPLSNFVALHLASYFTELPKRKASPDIPVADSL